MTYETNTETLKDKDGTEALGTRNENGTEAMDRKNDNEPKVKEKEKAPDFPQVPYRTCAEYARYMEGNPDNNSNARHNPAPEDGMTLAELGVKTDAEILGIINDMASTNQKSDIRIMYARGYAFTWDDLRTIARFKDFQCDNPSERCPIYYSDKVTGIKPEDTDDFCRIFIDHGTRKDKVIKKITLSDSIASKFDELLGTELSAIERSKVVEAILDKCVSDMLEKKKVGKFGVSYRPMEREDVI